MRTFYGLGLAALMLLGTIASGSRAEPYELRPTTLYAQQSLPRVAIIIDDIGNDWHRHKQLLQLPVPLTLSILPHTPFAKRFARQAHARGLEVMVHAPMSNTQNLPLGPGALTPEQNQQQFLGTLRSDLASVPHAKGLNNHMGSLLTQQGRPMDWLMQELKRHRLYFVDSLTTPNSVAWRRAREAGVNNLRRDIFLDSRNEPAFIRAQYQKLLQLARQRGLAVAIGHPYPHTLKMLAEELPRLQAQGFRLVAVSELLDSQS